MEISDIASIGALALSFITGVLTFLVNRSHAKNEETKTEADAAGTITEASVAVVNMLQEQVKAQDEEIKALRQELAEVKCTYEKRIAELTTELEVAQARIAELERKQRDAC